MTRPFVRVLLVTSLALLAADTLPAEANCGGTETMKVYTGHKDVCPTFCGIDCQADPHWVRCENPYVLIRCMSGSVTSQSGSVNTCKLPPDHVSQVNSDPCTFEKVTGCTENNNCDGIDNDEDGLPDEGCEGPNQCEASDHQDSVYFTTRMVETTPRVDFRLPSSDLSLAMVRRYVQGDSAEPTSLSMTAGYANPWLLDYRQEPTSVGHHWRMSFQDRLYLPTTAMGIGTRPSWISWRGDVAVKFTPDSYVADASPYWQYHSHDGIHELRYYGVALTRIINHATGQVWQFSVSDKYQVGGDNGVALLDRMSRPAEMTTFTGGYWIDVARDNDERITQLIDADGRTLTFTYTDGALVSEIRLGTQILVRYRYFPDDASHPPPPGRLSSHFLERAETGFVGSTPTTYVRYLYQDVLDGQVVQTQRVLKTIVVPGQSGTWPAVGEPAVVAGEVVIATHEFIGTSSGIKAKRVTTASNDFGYSGGAGFTRQYDLRRPKLVSGNKMACTTDSQCGAGSGYNCWTTSESGDGYCYRRVELPWTSDTRKTLSKTGLCQNCGSQWLYHDGTQSWKLKRSIDPGGQATTYTWDAKGRPLCIVQGDNNQTAGSPPTCEGPATAQIRWFSYSGAVTSCNLTESQMRKSIVTGASPSETGTTLAYDCSGHVTSRSVVGWTRTIAGTAVQQTRTTTFGYDSLGRVTQQDGPLPNATAYDVTTYGYFGATGDDNAQRLQTVTRYVGTSATCPGASCVTLVTTYGNYDRFGTARSETDPSGVTMTRVTDALGRVTEERVTKAGGDETRAYTFNADSTLRSLVDGDGVCFTYDYNASGLLKARRRSATGAPCGVVPIVPTTGEVEVLTYDVMFPVQVARVERFTDGVLQYQKDVGYEERGYAATETSPFDNTKTRKLTYDLDGLLTLDERENCYAGSTTCSKNAFTFDTMGRRTSDRRQVTDTQQAVTGFSFASPTHLFPSTVTTGDGTTTATTSSYVFDDFGQLVEYVSPDSGTTRTEYDVAGRTITRREGAGTADQRTVSTTYDSLGRVVAVDHDTEHPVDCATAPAGTPVTDEEYFYDACPTPQPTGFTCGSYIKGRMTLARIKQHCSGGTTFRRGTWYEYGQSGRIARVANVDDSIMATPYLTTYTWTPGGRALTIGHPLSTLYGMKFLYDSVGDVTEVRQTDVAGTQYLYERTHVAFGPTKSYKTMSISGGQPLIIDTTYFPNYTVQTKKGVRNGVTLGGFTYTRDETGRVTSRDSLWASDIIDRWYRYDRVGRLLCETTTSTSSCPTSGASLRATYTYNNGTGGLAPDNRASAVFQTTGIDFPLGVPGNYVYAANSNRLTQAASTLQIFHDSLGRRTKDDDTYFPATYDDKREYTYLPNGRLGTIRGKLPNREEGITERLLDDYTLAIAYDHRGRMVQWTYTIEPGRTYSGTDIYNLFYDEDDRLIGWKWTPNMNEFGNSTLTRAAFVYLGRERVASVRWSNTTTSTTWVLSDDMGVEYEAHGTTGNSGRRDTEAFGHSAQADRQSINFRLPGQVAFPGTEVIAYDPAATGCGGEEEPACPILGVRDYMSANGARIADVSLGAFGSTDPMEQLKPWEHQDSFTYANNDPIRFADPSGLDAVDPITCASSTKMTRTAIGLAYFNVATCPNISCSLERRKKWLESLSRMSWKCGLAERNMPASTDTTTHACTVSQRSLTRERLIRPAFGSDDIGPVCLPFILAHEALHDTRIFSGMTNNDEDFFINDLVFGCMGSGCTGFQR